MIYWFLTQLKCTQFKRIQPWQRVLNKNPPFSNFVCPISQFLYIKGLKLLYLSTQYTPNYGGKTQDFKSSKQKLRYKEHKTRLITMRSKPDYVEFQLLQLLLMLLLWFLLLQLFIRGWLWSMKVYLIHIKAITVVALASRPCLDLSLTLLLP